MTKCSLGASSLSDNDMWQTVTVTGGSIAYHHLDGCIHMMRSGPLPASQPPQVHQPQEHYHQPLATTSISTSHPLQPGDPPFPETTVIPHLQDGSTERHIHLQSNKQDGM